jgi:hypothetical protein
MKVFRELEIFCSDDVIVPLVDKIENRLDRGWVRDRKEEERLKKVLSSTFIFSFRCDEQANRPAAHLGLMRRAINHFYVPNVVPVEMGRLDYDQYNFIVAEFYLNFVKPVATELAVETKMTSDEESIADLISADAYHQLLAFSRGANKSTGSSHPSDRARWMRYLVTMHHEDWPLDTETFRRWLVEEAEWPAEVASDLTIEYEFARELLRTFKTFA